MKREDIGGLLVGDTEWTVYCARMELQKQNEDIKVASFMEMPHIPAESIRFALSRFQKLHLVEVRTGSLTSERHLLPTFDHDHVLRVIDAVQPSLIDESDDSTLICPECAKVFEVASAAVMKAFMQGNNVECCGQEVVTPTTPTTDESIDHTRTIVVADRDAQKSD